MAGAVMLGPAGAAWAQEELPPDDPTISEQQADTPTATVEDGSCGTEQTAPCETTVTIESGCEQDPVICQSAVPLDASPVSSGSVSSGSVSSGSVSSGSVSQPRGAAELPRTGPTGALLATGALGVALVLAGGGAVAAGRRRTA